MKKIIIAAIALVMVTGFAFSQEQVPGFSNTVYTNVGTIIDVGNGIKQDARDNVKFDGFIDYFTANITANGITIAGDIAWQVLDGGSSFTAKYLAHNFNAVMTPFANFNIGIGTNLDWSVGPKPFSGPEYAAYEVPYYAGVEGAPVTSHYADGSFAARYFFEDVLEVGFGLNSGSSDFSGAGVGIKANIEDIAAIGFAYNGTFKESDSNIYLGASLYTVPGFDIDIWTNFEVKSSTSIGGRLAFYKDAFRLIPEFTMSFYENIDPTFYAALVSEMSLSREMLVGINASFGVGKDSITASTTIDGQNRLNVSPFFVWNLSKAHRLSAAINIIGFFHENEADFYWGIPISWKVLF